METLPEKPSAGPDPIDVAVGLSIRTLRKSKGITQDQLGEALGITFQQIQKYERGTNRVSASMLVKAARYLEVSAAALLPEEGDPTPRSPAVLALIARVPGMEELIQAFAGIKSAKARRALLNLARSLVSPDEPGADGASDPGELAA